MHRHVCIKMFCVISKRRYGGYKRYNNIDRILLYEKLTK